METTGSHGFITRPGSLASFSLTAIAKNASKGATTAGKHVITRSGSLASLSTASSVGRGSISSLGRLSTGSICSTISAAHGVETVATTVSTAVHGAEAVTATVSTAAHGVEAVASTTTTVANVGKTAQKTFSALSKTLIVAGGVVCLTDICLTWSLDNPTVSSLDATINGLSTKIGELNTEIENLDLKNIRPPTLDIIEKCFRTEDFEALTEEDIRQIVLELEGVRDQILRERTIEEIMAIWLNKFFQELIAAVRSRNLQEIRRLFGEFAVQMLCHELGDILQCLAQYAGLLNTQAEGLNFLEIVMIYIRIFVRCVLRVDSRRTLHVNGRYFLGQIEDYNVMDINTSGGDQNCYYVTLSALKMQNARRFSNETQQKEQNRASTEEIVRLYQQANLKSPTIEQLGNPEALRARVLELKGDRPYAVFGLGIDGGHMVVLQADPENILRIIDFQIGPGEARVFDIRLGPQKYWGQERNYQLFIAESPAEAMLNLLYYIFFK